MCGVGSVEWGVLSLCCGFILCVVGFVVCMLCVYVWDV